jgi:beta-glucanase (GH16 family)
MKKLSFFISAILMFIAMLQYTAYAQAPPITDNNFPLDLSKSDDFSGLTLNSNLWDKGYSGCGWGAGFGASLNSLNVLLLDDDYLRLRLSKSGDNLYVGQIRSKNSDYSYGYFEISAKLLDPGSYYNDQPCVKGIWPTFWLYYADYDLYPCYHDEIDIIDNLYETNEDCHFIDGGILDVNPEALDPSLTVCTGVPRFEYHYQNVNPLFENEHRYGVEWRPDRVIYYFDDIPVGEYYGSYIPRHSLWVVLAMQVNTGFWDNNITLSQDYKVHYFRYYKFNMDCGNDANLTNSSLFNSFVFAVKRNITIGNGSSVISMSAGDKKTFRATDDIIINGDFTVPLESELNLIPTICF